MKNVFSIFLPRKELEIYLEVGIFPTSLEAIDMKKLLNWLAIKKSFVMVCLFVFKAFCCDFWNCLCLWGSWCRFIFLLRFFFFVIFEVGFKIVFFFYMGFLSHDIHDSQNSRVRGRPFLVPLYHLHPLHEHWHISQTIAAESSPLHIASGRTRTGNLWFPSANR